MSRVRVKICGITRQEDAELAVQLGADAVGFVFWLDSPRRVTPAQVAVIAKGLPASVARVGVFVDAPPDEVRDAVEKAGLDAVQLHGAESVADYRLPGVTLIKSFDLAADVDTAWAIALPRHVTPLVDAHDRIRRGGTGQVANWTRAADVARARPILLAGGLSEATVASAIDRVHPWGVDVSSGVESSPGVKSPERLRAFFAAVAGTGDERER
jgi:phosphoribosylanthranilate isomerase